MEIRERLQKLRKEKGYSQEELAEILGISRQAISKWESGQSSPDINKLIQLSELYGVSIDTILKGTDDSVIDKDNSTESIKQENHYHYYGGYRYEYKSKREIFGLPLVHINIGRGFYKAKGIIAVGTIAMGLVSCGVFSIGLLSSGAFALGLISLAAIAIGLGAAFGGIALGILAVGGLAIGVFSIGGLAVGMFSIGGASIASNIAIGSYAKGHIAIGDTAIGERTITTINNNFKNVSSSEVRKMIYEEFPKLWSVAVKWLTFMFK